MDPEYISLIELYITDRTLFKTKSLKGFLTTHKVPESAVQKIKSKLHISSAWIKKHLPSFNTSLPESPKSRKSPKSPKSPESGGVGEFFEINSTLADIGAKRFNPIAFNFDSTHIKYFSNPTEKGSRIPYFTQKGLIKAKMVLNNYEDCIFAWINELERGQLKEEKHNLHNVQAMLVCKTPPILKKTPNGLDVLDNVFDVGLNDVIVNLKTVGDLRRALKAAKPEEVDALVSKYRCPVYNKLQEEFQTQLKELRINHENQIKELKQEKIVHSLQQELEKEKSLKIQALSLTQSFIPHSIKVAADSQKESPPSSPTIPFGGEKQPRVINASRITLKSSKIL